MANTYTLIASTTVGSGGASSIDFTSIPATYTDLVIKLSGRTTDSSTATMNIRFNGSTSGYSERMLYDASGSAASASRTGTSLIWTYILYAGYTANTFNNAEIYIPNYAGSNNKSVSIDNVMENNAADIVLNFDAGLWSNTAAINQITLSPVAGNFVQYSTAYLYGIKSS